MSIYALTTSGSRSKPGQAGAPQRRAVELANGLGWFSIGLGLAELLAPRALAKTLGLEGSETTLQAFGAREIATGIGILTAKNKAPFIWGRVAGDALDLLALARGLESSRSRPAVEVALASVALITALDVSCARSLDAGADDGATRRPDYSGRSGFPLYPSAMRGAASDFKAPRDMRTPALLRPLDAAPEARSA